MYDCFYKFIRCNFYVLPVSSLGFLWVPWLAEGVPTASNSNNKNYSDKRLSQQPALRALPFLWAKQTSAVIFLHL